MGLFDKLRGLLSATPLDDAAASRAAASRPFEFGPAHEFAAEHRILNEFLAANPGGSIGWETMRACDKLKPEDRSRMAAAALERLCDIAKKEDALRTSRAGHCAEGMALLDMRCQFFTVITRLAKNGTPFLDKALLNWLEWSVTAQGLFPQHNGGDWLGYLIQFESAVARAGNPGRQCEQLRKLCRVLLSDPQMRKSDWTKLCAIRDRLGVRRELDTTAGEKWIQQASFALMALPPEAQAAWERLLDQLEDSDGSEPSAKWLDQTRRLAEAPGIGDWQARVQGWLSGFCASDPETVSFSPNFKLDEIKGIGWLCAFATQQDLLHLLPECAAAAYRLVGRFTSAAAAAGNAFIIALGIRADAWSLGQLALLRARIKRPQAQKCLEKALTLAAKKTGSTPDEIAESNVPACGLTGVGALERKIGGYTARIHAAGPHTVELNWRNAQGREQTSVPKEVRDSFPEDLKSIKGVCKEVEKMLAAQMLRVEAVYLQQRRWPLAAWREHYLDHALMGILARRLIWKFTNAGRVEAGVWNDGQLVTRSGGPVKVTDETTVELWHPLDAPAEEVLAWRHWLEAKECVQPFKQAHREIYLLTPAEAETVTYSNRFAAHLLRQHQFHALAAARGWRHSFNLPFADGGSDAFRDVLRWELRAEFQVAGAGEETADSGVFLHVATDQVRLFRLNGKRADPEPLRLADVPPLVFSEIMRDVDLFIGVASVGNDPAWRDGGQREQFGAQWQHFAFGDLSATAKTRREVLERLVPKLKIAAQCSFEEKFLVVRGKLRTYKIHLGSGNILMSPNDQYLCIVASRGKAEPGSIFLPFEGDSVLSLVISKALLLASDDKISDASITRQIRAM